MALRNSFQDRLGKIVYQDLHFLQMKLSMVLPIGFLSEIGSGFRPALLVKS